MSLTIAEVAGNENALNGWVCHDVVHGVIAVLGLSKVANDAKHVGQVFANAGVGSEGIHGAPGVGGGIAHAVKVFGVGVEVSEGGLMDLAAGVQLISVLADHASGGFGQGRRVC